ncbi:transcription repressor NadR [Neobacillus sp. OS1-32]|jgi:transcriptional regulator of NAD metabolism|uniref:Transcription repressor NadR n=1 Tax=Neobacillus paridis TaxID=2803862 RepID=A0ABS1TJ06_9BACI|nr:MULTISPECIES: transcription repressor NadR [Neobacillus]MBL4951257.1 transcription repressor NadR [Neobacillus paridis]WML30574.1 transcription repressor NadR [Neobacillus sp. OS1-32]
MMEQKKILGDERRKFILQLLRESSHPITGSELAEKTNVSRQVIVGDITLLKAKGEPIIATSQGYMFLQQPAGNIIYQRIIACRHTPAETEKELNMIVDHGVTVKDVKIEHAVYGDLTASIMVSNREEVKQFMNKLETTKAPLLSELTGGIHLHTLTAARETDLDRAETALKKEGILLE